MCHHLFDQVPVDGHLGCSLVYFPCDNNGENLLLVLSGNMCQAPIRHWGKAIKFKICPQVTPMSPQGPPLACCSDCLLQGTKKPLFEWMFLLFSHTFHLCYSPKRLNPSDHLSSSSTPWPPSFPTGSGPKVHSPSSLLPLRSVSCQRPTPTSIQGLLGSGSPYHCVCLFNYFNIHHVSHSALHCCCSHLYMCVESICPILDYRVLEDRDQAP